jgi:AcrR family transcriptional regulator
MPAARAASPGLRDRRRDQTRQEIAEAALTLALRHGLADVRIPQIAAAAGVSPRTVNNYFASKEAAVAWPAGAHAAAMAVGLRDRPADEPLAVALRQAVLARYGRQRLDGLPAGWLRDFRRLVGAEPSLRGEYLKAHDAAERALAEAIAERSGCDDLRARVLAAMVVGAERAAVRHFMAAGGQRGALADTVGAALDQALAGVAS